MSKRDYIEYRALEIGMYLIETRGTVRSAAKKFGVSKSTVHKDITHRLEKIYPDMADQVREILDVNTKERVIRGGEATRKKHLLKSLA